MSTLNLFEELEEFEKTMVLEVNNAIKFPVKIIKAYNENDEFITMQGDFMKLNIPCLLSNEQARVLEIITRQKNRLNSGINYEKVMELAEQNAYFNNALTMYHSSFSVSDYKVGFILLVTALEALLSLSTYSKPEKCEKCGQTKYRIRNTISENVGILLMDKEDLIKREVKKMYDKRSKFLHNGVVDITKYDEQVMQEYVRKVLLMYWCVSMYKSSNEHKEVISEIQTPEYGKNILYQTFLIGLDNISFAEKRTAILKQIVSDIIIK